MAAIFSKSSGKGSELDIELVDSDPAFGPHIGISTSKAQAAISLSDKEIEDVRQWCERIQNRRKEIDDLLNDAEGVARAL